jgi:hypothetical protein
MRILDIGVATAYALLCLSLVSVMAPYGSQIQAAESAADAHASQAVYQYIQSVGLVFLADASPSQVCASLEQYGNSTVTLGGTVAGQRCPGAPATFRGHYSLDLSLSGREDVLEAWTEGA